MEEVGFVNFSGRVLRLLTDDQPFPAGTPAYCFLDTGEEFRVQTGAVYWGGTEFAYSNSSRCKFKIIQ